jgi:hypothetical protein
MRSRWVVQSPCGSAWKSINQRRVWTIPPDPWLSPPPHSATACYPGNRHRRASAERCDQPYIRDNVRPSIPLTDTDALAGTYGAPANCGESARLASARMKSNRSIGDASGCYRPACPSRSDSRSSTSVRVSDRILRPGCSIVERRRTLRWLREVQMFQFGTETWSSQWVVARRGPG